MGMGVFFFFFQAEDGIRDLTVTGVQTCALPIFIILTSLIFSQLLSNVPFVAVYIKAMQAAGFTGTNVKAWVALAGASTLAGGLSLLGAASNVIILEAAESRGSGFSSLEFSKIGLLVTIPNILILYLFLRIL